MEHSDYTSKIGLFSSEEIKGKCYPVISFSSQLGEYQTNTISETCCPSLISVQAIMSFLSRNGNRSDLTSLFLESQESTYRNEVR